MAQLSIDGFCRPFRADRNSNGRDGGGILIYIRSDIPCRQLNKHEFPDSIEGLFVEINFRKSKWLFLGTYHPPSQNDKFYFKHIGLALDIYTQTYDKILLTRDFNAEENETILENFMVLYFMTLKIWLKKTRAISRSKILRALICFLPIVVDLFSIQK